MLIDSYLLFLQVGGIHLNKWKLDKKLGFCVLFLYAIFLCFSIMIEFNVFTFVNLPMCREDDWNTALVGCHLDPFVLQMTGAICISACCLSKIWVSFLLHHLAFPLLARKTDNSSDSTQAQGNQSFFFIFLLGYDCCVVQLFGSPAELAEVQFQRYLLLWFSSLSFFRQTIIHQHQV